jgi:hypothetical protein
VVLLVALKVPRRRTVTMKVTRRPLAVIAQPQPETSVVGVRLQLVMGLVVPVLDHRRLQIALSLLLFLFQLPLSTSSHRHRPRLKYLLVLRRVPSSNILRYLNLLNTEPPQREDTLMLNIMVIMHLVGVMLEVQQTQACTAVTWACPLQVLTHTLDLVALAAREVNL